MKDRFFWLLALVGALQALSGCFDSGGSQTQLFSQCEEGDKMCDGDIAVDCRDSDKSFSKTTVRTNCADTGQICLFTPASDNNTERATCVLNTDICEGSDSYCDGSLRFACTSGGYLDNESGYESDAFDRHISLVEDCGQYRQSCFDDGNGTALCALNEESCDDNDPPRCDDERAVRCIEGRWVATDDCSRPSRECELFGECQDVARTCVAGENFAFCE